jgi:hypothetical protein
MTTESPQRVKPETLAGAFGGSRLTRVEKLPNGRAFYFDVPVRRAWLKAPGRLEWIVRRLMAGGAYPSLLPDLQRGGVGDSGVPVKTQVVVFQVLLTPASVATIVAAEQLITVTGVLAGDIVVIAANSLAPATAVGAATARVSAANQIGIIYINPTAGALVPTPGTYNVVVLRG